MIGFLCRNWKKRWFRVLSLSAGILLLLFAILPFSLYIPAVQDYFCRVVVEKVSESTGYKIGIGRFLLKFPVKLAVDDFSVLDAKGDTMVAGSRAAIDVRVLPLLMGDVVVRGVDAENAVYKMVSPDSSMVLSARIDNFKLENSTVELLTEWINLSDATIDGADVSLLMDMRKSKPEKADTTANPSWLIGLENLKLRNVRYHMSMMPAIDSLDVVLGNADVAGLAVNLAVGTVKAGSLAIDSISAAYFVPTEADSEKFLASYDQPVDTAPSLPSKTWTVFTKKIRVTNSDALYAVKGSDPSDGMDFNHLAINDLNVEIDNFYNRGSKLRVPVRNITAKERSGIELKKVAGVVEIDENKISADSVRLETLLSGITVDGFVENALLSGNKDAKVDVSVVSDISLEEIGKAVPSVRSVLRSVSRVENAHSEIVVKGTGKEIGIDRLDFEVPRIVSLSANGTVRDFMDAGSMDGIIEFGGKLTGGNTLRPLLGLDKAVRVPQVTMKGKATYGNSRLSAAFSAFVGNGMVVADGRWNSRGRSYEAEVKFRDFDARSIMPNGGLGKMDCSISAKGRGYDLYRMKAAVSTDIGRVVYNGVAYDNIVLDGSIDNGNYSLMASSQNEFASMGLDVSGSISHDALNASVEGSVFNADFAAMNLVDTVLDGSLDIKAELVANTKKQYYLGLLKLSGINVNYGETELQTDSINLGFFSNEENTNFRLGNDDMVMTVVSPHSVADWQEAFGRLAVAVDSAIVRQNVDIAEIKGILPSFKAKMSAGSDNVAYQFLSSSGIGYDRLDLEIDKDSDLVVNSTLRNLAVAGIAVDTISIKGNTAADSLSYELHVGNTALNSGLLKYADVAGSLRGNTASVRLHHVDNSGVDGFDFGMDLSIADSVVRMNLFPENPVIAFKDWKINTDNYISYHLGSNAVRADLDVRSGDASHISIYTDNPPDVNNGVNVDLAGIGLKDWLSLSPFSPPVDGTLSAKFKVFYNDKYVWGNGDLGVDELYYGKNRVGDIGIDSRVAYVGEDQSVYTMMQMELDGRKIARLHGSKKDTLSQPIYDMKLDIDRLPLAVANAFVPDGMALASGYMDVDMNVEGTFDNPDIKGYLKFDSAAVAMPVFGTRFKFDTIPVDINDGHVRFNEFGLFGSNGNPVRVDGSLRFIPAGRLYSDLVVSGKNVQVVDGKKTGKSELYGKGFVDLRARVKGYMDGLDMNASLSVLSGTNLTYVMQSDATAVAQSADDDVVTFVQFNDTVKHDVDSVMKRQFAMKINADLTVQPNTLFTINLSPDGKNKVQLDGEGSLNYSQSYQGDMRMTGRYVVNGGFVRYSPPMLSEKLFNFTEGSSVSWTGDILNPTLDIKAVETVKANVTSNQNSRLVPFDVILNVGNTLNRLDVSFDLSTDADITIANELSGMTKEQRSSQAMNLLLYGSYTGAATTTNSSLSGENMAYSFLESTLNKWAANNISGVDLSFGINQYDRTVDGTTSSTTSYSYKVSKSVFDDRFKIVVGGNYSTDESADDNLAQNLFNDISFEYKLNKAGSTYVKLFHHTEYESILEGEITETGGGFVWKRKISSFRDIFNVFRKKRKPQIEEDK